MRNALITLASLKTPCNYKPLNHCGVALKQISDFLLIACVSQLHGKIAHSQVRWCSVTELTGKTSMRSI